MRFMQVLRVPNLGRSRRFSLRSLFLLVTIMAFALLFYRPTRTVTAVLSFPILPTGATNAEAHLHAQTHAALLRGPFVLNTAIRRSDVNKLEIIRRQANPVEWIQSKMVVGFPMRPGGKTASVALSTREGDVAELKLIVDAIVDAYHQEIGVK